MSDDTTEPTDEAPPPKWSPEDDPDGYTWDDIRPKDFLLESLLDFYVGGDDTSAEGAIGITVLSGGLTVSGIAISRRAWIDAMKATFAKSMTSDYSDAIGTVYDMTAERLEDVYKRRDAADLPTHKRTHLHMRDVRIIMGVDDHVTMPLWRGTLDDVTGWSMGSWNPAGSAEPVE